jgi:predicted MFS family arabinose efflux permease
MQGGSPTTPARANYVLAVLVAVYVVNFIDRQILSILLEPIKRELQVSDSAMGFLTGFAFAAFYTTAGIPIARWADRGTRRTIIALGLALWSGMTALSGLARTFPQLALARVGVGVGEAAASPAAHSMISDLFPPERRATALAIYTTGANLGILLALALGGWINDAFGWRTAFFVVGLPGLVLAAVVWRSVPEPMRGRAEGRVAAQQPPRLAEVLGYLWRLRAFRHLSLAAALYAFAGYAFGMWGPTFLIRVHGLSTTEVGRGFGLIYGIGGALGALIGGRLTDRLARRDPRFGLWLPALGALLALPPTIAFLFWPDWRGALACYLPGVVLASLYVGPSFSITQSLAQLRMRALAAAVVLFVINLVGMGLGPWAVGVLNELLSARHGPQAVRYSLLAIAAVNLWAVVHALLCARALRQDLATAQAQSVT